MSWRELLGGVPHDHDHPSQYSHNSQKSEGPVNSANTANNANETSEVNAALQRFIDLVRATAACEHGRLLHRSTIEAELDQADREALLTTTVEERQAWAALLAHRLTRPGPRWAAE